MTNIFISETVIIKFYINIIKSGYNMLGVFDVCLVLIRITVKTA